MAVSLFEHSRIAYDAAVEMLAEQSFEKHCSIESVMAKNDMIVAKLQIIISSRAVRNHGPGAEELSFFLRGERNGKEKDIVQSSRHQ